MGAYVERLWHPEDAGGLSRKDRAPGRYLAYVPDELGDSLPMLGAEAQGAAEDALAVLARADERIGARGRYLNHLLIRSESISSSWIEGNRVTPKRLAIAELLHQGPRQALDVVANVRATESAIAELADHTRTIETSDIVDLQHVIEPRLERGVRQEQNWVGGPGWSPLRAAFVPPPETEVPRLVADLARFVTDTAGNPVVRAAIAHAQFETIHPFTDGNGRTGRALAQACLRSYGVIQQVTMPVSAGLLSAVEDYYEALTAYRAGDLDPIVAAFSSAAFHAVGNGGRLVRDLLEIRARWRTSLRARSDASVWRALPVVMSQPALTVNVLAERIGISVTAAQTAIDQMVAAEVLALANAHRRNRVWVAREVLDALDEFARRAGRRRLPDQRSR